MSACFCVYFVEQELIYVLLWQRSMNLFMQSGLQRDVLFVDGLRIGTITK